MIGYGAGTDFETRIVIKPLAPILLRSELKKLRSEIPHLEFSFATDPYLPIEAEYKLTRKCLEVCADFQMPVAVITKSPLITRDLDILKRLKATVFFSIPFFSKESSNPFEPFAPVPEARFRAMKRLTDEGITVGIAIAPLIPGYNESDIPKLLKKAKECGASLTFMSLLHIDTDSIEEYFLKRMREKLSPQKMQKIVNSIKRERGGKLQHLSFKERSLGITKQWEMAVDLFNFHVKKMGFNQKHFSEEEGAPGDLPLQADAKEPSVLQQSLF
jgi:DNA repair photolyase